MAVSTFRTGLSEGTYRRILINYSFSETRFYGYDKENKNYNAEAHRDRIFGKHVADYMK
jgi:hypothetical protein